MFEWYSNTLIRDTILSENNKELQDFLIFNTTLPKIITYRIILFLGIILFFPNLFCTFVTVSVDWAKIFSAKNVANETEHHILEGVILRFVFGYSKLRNFRIAVQNIAEMTATGCS